MTQTASTQNENGEIEIDRQRIYEVWQQFTDLLLKTSDSDSRPASNESTWSSSNARKQNADSLDHGGSSGKVEKQNADSLDHPPTSLLQNQNSEPPDPQMQQTAGSYS